MELIYIWLGISIFFLLVEMMTATLYGLSMFLAGLLVVAYIYFTNETSLSLAQIVIFTIFSTIFIFIFPRFFSLTGETKEVGAKAYIGKTRTLKKVGKDFKIELDGVDYIVDDDCVMDDFEEGKKVIVDGADGGNIQVKLK